MAETYDVLVVGCGPAGMTAGVYLARAQLTCLVITQDIGGQAAWGPEIENYLGYRMISGVDLVNKFHEHLRTFPQIHQEFGQVRTVRALDGGFEVDADGATYRGRTMIYAAGRSPRKLQVPGETEYLGLGVSYCSVCDGPLFKGKRVVVAGGGNAGFGAAVQMTSIASHVTVVEVMPQCPAEAAYKHRLQREQNVDILTGVRITEIIGDAGGVQAVRLQTVATGEERELPAQGVFVEIGSVPNSGPVADLVQRTPGGEIEINCSCETSHPGLFAAGDVTNVVAKQIIVAAGEGAKAALSAVEYLVRQG